MRHFILIISVFLCLTRSAHAQCNSGLFTASDTICPLRPVVIDNAADTALRYNWDFGPGDLDSLPVPIDVNGWTSLAEGMTIIKENGNFYGFITCAWTGYLLRFDFGNSLHNTPGVVALNANSLLSGFASGIEMVKEGNKWIGFVGTYVTNHLIRMELDSITQNSPVFTDLGSSNINGPVHLKLFGQYLFATNNTSDISRFDFGNSFLNTPTAILPMINIGLNYNGQLDIDYDCQSGKYISYIAAYQGNQLVKLDFGNSLANSPTITNAFTMPTPFGIAVENDGGNWHLFCTSLSNEFYHYKLGNSLDNALTFDYKTSFPGLLNNPVALQMIHDGSDWNGLIVNQGSHVVLLDFPQAPNNTSTFGSTQQSPNNLTYKSGTSGYQVFSCTSTYPNGVERVYLDSVYVDIPPPVAAFSVSPGCMNSPISFTNSSDVCYGTLTGYHWDFGDGNTDTTANPQHTYSATGNYQITLTVYGSNNDSASITKSLYIYEIPVSNFSLTDSICAGGIVNFTDLSTSTDGVINTWNWNFGDGQTAASASPGHSYSQAGNYQVQLEVVSSTGCRSTSTKTLNVKDNPQAAYKASNTCIGETVQFTNLSTVNSGTLTGYQWNFGDLNTDNIANPTHAYPAAANTYTITLIAMASNGCNDTIVNSIHIGEKPSPWFTMSIDTACVGNAITFTDSSFAAIGDSILARYWDFGDNIYDTSKTTLTHSYALPGMYQVSLTVVSPTHCDSTITRNVFVIESPTADFTTSNVCLNSSTPFVDLSQSPSGSSIVQWNWKFGDGDSSTVQSPAHNYTSAGSYQVLLQVTSNKGCFDTLSKQVFVYALPIVSFGFTKACTGTAVQFTDSSSVNGSSISAWNWDFSNGNTSNLQHPQTVYNGAFAYPVKLVATSLFGCSDSLTRLLAVSQSPVYTINANDNCLGSPTSFTYTSGGGSISNMRFNWLFGDSTAATQSNPSHVYANAGIYTYQLTVTDISNGCVTAKTDSVQIHSFPQAKFLTDSACVYKLLQFTDQSTIQGESIASWKWTMGNYGQSTQQHPTLVVNQADSFAVKLVVSSTFGCKDSITKMAEVYPTPFTNFTPNPVYGAPPMDVTFNNSSDPGTYFWDFGDNGATSTLAQPHYIYADTGTFSTLLIATSPRGCVDSTRKSILVRASNLDLSMEGINFVKKNNWWEISAVFRNIGNIDITGFSVNSKLDGRSMFNERFNRDTLLPGASKLFTFNTRFESSITEDPGFLCLEIMDVNNKLDDVDANNKRCLTAKTAFEIFGMYPNPVQDQLNVGLNMAEEGEVKINVMSSTGQTCSTEMTLSLQAGYNSFEIPVSHLSAGLYVLMIEYNGNQLKENFGKY